VRLWSRERRGLAVCLQLEKAACSLGLEGTLIYGLHCIINWSAFETISGSGTEEAVSCQGNGSQKI
jgi:hypothetical protein